MKLIKKPPSLISTILSGSFVITVVLLLFFQPPIYTSWMNSLERWAYDFTIKRYHLPLTTNTPIAIVDIDDKSLKQMGRWPWSRNIMADLVSKLQKLGATVIAFDVLFSEPEINIAEEVLKALPRKGDYFNAIIKNFDYDDQFATSLKAGESVLATVFSIDKQLQDVGDLPKPLLTLTDEDANELNITEMQSYTSNVSVLEKAAKHGGFINATPDEDGVIRESPLILRYKNGIYPSLPLKAVEQYLLIKDIRLRTNKYQGIPVLEGVELDNIFIPTDPQGRHLIPFRGSPYSFPFISASDVLNGKVDTKEIANKIIFVGSSAAGLGDIRPTAIASAFFGIEVHASIASGILDNYLPHTPAWTKGVTISLTLILGLLLAFLLPRLGAILSAVTTILVTGALFSFNILMLSKNEIFLSLSPPILTILFLYTFDTIFEYFMESRQKNEIKSIFGLYVPPDYLELMIDHSKTLTTEGVSKELTVLFADIQDFTNISEKLDAQGVKTLLNTMLTSMTQVIFDDQGTVDKYVGDMIMAFWGAPLDDPKHAEHAVHAALKMSTELETKVNPTLSQDTQLHLRFGLNTGMMNVGDMGSQFRRAYTVLGDPVNLASRLEAICKYYSIFILVGENTWEQTKEKFLYRTVDKIKAKGKETSVNIYEPICIKEEETQELRDEIGAHEQALQSYRSQKWDEAEQMFSKLHAAHPKYEGLYQVYLDRIKDFKNTPPPQDWDGSYTFTTK